MSNPEITVIDGGDTSAELSPELAAKGAQFMSTGVTIMLPFFEDPAPLALPLISMISHYERSMLTENPANCQRAGFDSLCTSLSNMVLAATIDGNTGLAKVTHIPWKTAEKEKLKFDKDIISAMLELPAGARMTISKQMIISMLAKVLAGKAGIDPADLPKELQDAIKQEESGGTPKQTH